PVPVLAGGDRLVGGAGDALRAPVCELVGHLDERVRRHVQRLDGVGPEVVERHGGGGGRRAVGGERRGGLLDVLAQGVVEDELHGLDERQPLRGGARPAGQLLGGGAQHLVHEGEDRRPVQAAVLDV